MQGEACATRRRRLGSERGHARLDGRSAWGPFSARITSITCTSDICQHLSGSAAVPDFRGHNF